MQEILNGAIERLSALIRLPQIVCLCGSTRFFHEFADSNYRLTMDGEIVLSVGFFMHATGNQHGGTIGASDEQKAGLDVLHLRKIDLADSVYVINVGGYVGASTRRELWYAQKNYKPIRWREPNLAFSPEQIDSWFADLTAWECAAKPAATV